MLCPGPRVILKMAAVVAGGGSSSLSAPSIGEECRGQFASHASTLTHTLHTILTHLCPTLTLFGLPRSQCLTRCEGLPRSPLSSFFFLFFLE